MADHQILEGRAHFNNDAGESSFISQVGLHADGFHFSSETVHI